MAGFRPKGLDAITRSISSATFAAVSLTRAGVYDATFVNDYSVGLVSEDARAADPGIKRGDQRSHDASNVGSAVGLVHGRGTFVEPVS